MSKVSKGRRKLDRKNGQLVFISYARRPDMQFAELLGTALREARLEPWIDAQNLPYGEDWRREISVAIKDSLSVIFLVSPESIASKYCIEELDLALVYGKKIIPLLRRPTKYIPESIKNLHYLEVLDDSAFESKVSDLLVDLQTNKDWERLHIRLLNKSLDYKSAPKDNQHELLLSQYELSEAERWLQSADTRDENRIVPAVRHFLFESRRHRLRSDRIFAGYAKKISDEYKDDEDRETSEITQEIAELPMVQKAYIFSIVVRDAIRDGRGKLGNQFFYLLGDLPRALKLTKAYWASFIQTALSEGWFQYRAIFSMIAQNTFPIRSFLTACELAVSSGEPTAPVSYPIRTAKEGLVGLRPEFIRDNLDLADRLFKYAFSKAPQVIALIPVDTELERVKSEALREGIDANVASIAPELFEERKETMDSAYILLYDMLESLETYTIWDSLRKKFNPKRCLHLLGRLALSFVTNRHWGTAYEACQCLWELRLFDKSSTEMYVLPGFDRHKYAKRKCHEVLTIMQNSGAPLFWPAVIACRLEAKSEILKQLEVLRSEDRKLERDSFDSFAEDLLKGALKGEVRPFGKT